MKAHSQLFMRRVIAELLPPLHEGQSSLWNFYGYKLTRLPYRKADLLSFKDKEFILKLFPSTNLYHDVLPKQVQADIGKTGPGSRAARKLLTRIGFNNAAQIDPFDGGPHYVAKRQEITVYQKTRAYEHGETEALKGLGHRLVMAEDHGVIRAVVTASRVSKGQIFLPKEAVRLLDVDCGQQLYTYAMRS
jgi:arginine N-succinyltransferase